MEKNMKMCEAGGGGGCNYCGQGIPENRQE